MTNYTISAEKETIGRVATQAAMILMGKNTPHWERAKVPDVHLVIEHASKLSISDRKREQKTYVHYTGHSSGHRSETLASLVARKGYGAALEHAIYRMLPKNGLRDHRMKRLVIHE